MVGEGVSHLVYLYPQQLPPRLLFFLSVSKWCARAFVPHFGPLVGVAVYRAQAAVRGRNSSWECVCLAALYLVFTGLLFGQPGRDPYP